MGKRLVVFEALRCDYRHASDRLHQFVVDGMTDNAQRFDRSAIDYFPYVEFRVGAGRGLLAALARDACLVVTDDFPCFVIPCMGDAAARQLDVRLETMDSNGLLSSADAEQVFPTAYAFLRNLQKRLPEQLLEVPEFDPLATSGLSPYLHFGHLAIHAVFLSVAAHERWAASDLSATTTGKRAGWWGMSAPAEAFLDQGVTWRELGSNCCLRRDDCDRFESLPEWARATLAQHASDPRSVVYDLPALASARTHDPLWNAARMQLVRDGRIHSDLRIVWGKKILEWTRSTAATPTRTPASPGC